MNLHHGLAERAAAGRPVRVGLVGAGAFGRMFLAQVPRTAGLAVTAIADRAAASVAASLAEVGWDATAIAAVRVVADVPALLAGDDVDVVVEATGDAAAGVEHALGDDRRRPALVMVNVEADALAGPLLARRAAEAGVVYSLAYGDQPALICELVDWARTCGFEVVAAGKGTRHLPAFERSTPETVWNHYGIDPQRAREARFNAQMFNSFLDGTKSAIEMAAVANATGLDAPDDGLVFPPAGVGELRGAAPAGRRRRAGAQRDGGGRLEPGARRPRGGRDLRWGVYVVVRGGGRIGRRCFATTASSPTRPAATRRCTGRSI